MFDLLVWKCNDSKKIEPINNFQTKLCLMFVFKTNQISRILNQTFLNECDKITFSKERNFWMSLNKYESSPRNSLRIWKVWNVSSKCQLQSFFLFDWKHFRIVNDQREICGIIKMRNRLLYLYGMYCTSYTFVLV